MTEIKLHFQCGHLRWCVGQFLLLFISFPRPVTRCESCLSKIINLFSMLVLSFLVSSIGLFRLYSKTEQLEQLMGEEVTDINEILAVINNIQVILYSL